MEASKTDKRSAILQAALEIFAENGFHNSPTSLIAKKAEVGTGTIYRYFESKDDLIEALHQDLEQKIHSILLSAVPENAPIRERFIRIHANILTFLINNPFEFKFLEQYFNSPFGIEKKREKASGCDSPLALLFCEGIKQQIIKALPEPVLFALSFGPIIFLARDHLQGSFNLTEDVILTTLSASWDAVKR